MKALSIKEPWASMILKGRKTIETRTWATKYRGKLLLCASKKPESIISGKAFATAYLIDVRVMVKDDEILACCPIYKAYSWILKDIAPLQRPFEVKGKLGVFDIDISGMC